CRRRVQRETTRSQKYAYESPSHKSVGYRSHRPSMRPSYRPTGHRPHGPTTNPRRPTMNGARPDKSFFNQAPSYETRPFLKSSAVRTQYRAPWVPTVNRNNPSDSGCSRHMTGNISYLSDFEPFDGGYVSFGQGGCKITVKETIKTCKLKFENVYFVKDLKYNLFSVSQICDNKNSVLFTDAECIVLGRNFKLLDDANILLRTPRQHNMYSIDLNNIVPYKNLTCLVAKASADECTLWHRRLGENLETRK
nr:ribonuclease H-like domain-containing protein [Tanacetum cinerariifolium]